MIRPLLRLLCSVALATTLSQPVAAQAPPSSVSRLGQRIVEVRLVREGQTVDDPTVLALVETRVGDLLSMAQVRASITHIFGLGRFQDVQVDAVDAAGGVALRYNLIPVHSVVRVDFRGDPKLALSEDLLRDTIAARFGAVPPVGRAPEVARLLQQLYHDRGYLTATVAPSAVEKHDPDRTILVFTIRPGRPATIGNVRIDGDQPASRDQFLQLVRAVPGRPYQPNIIKEQLDNYAQRLRRRSHYEAVASYTAAPSHDGPGSNREGSIGRRRSDRGLGPAHPRFPEPAGLLEGGRDADTA